MECMDISPGIGLRPVSAGVDDGQTVLLEQFGQLAGVGDFAHVSCLLSLWLVDFCGVHTRPLLCYALRPDYE